MLRKICRRNNRILAITIPPFYVNELKFKQGDILFISTYAKIIHIGREQSPLAEGNYLRSIQRTAKYTLGVNIPARIVKKLELKSGQLIDMKIKDSNLIITINIKQED